MDVPWKMTNVLATSDNTQYTQEFRRKKDQEEKEPIQVNYENEKPYNSPLTEEEMNEALAGCAGSSPSLDHINYEFIKKMVRPEKTKILNAYEHIWRSGNFPTNWSEVFLIPMTDFFNKQVYEEDGEQETVPRSRKKKAIAETTIRLQKKPLYNRRA
jgi:hypothetical protein